MRALAGVQPHTAMKKDTIPPTQLCPWVLQLPVAPATVVELRDAYFPFHAPFLFYHPHVPPPPDFRSPFLCQCSIHVQLHPAPAHGWPGHQIIGRDREQTSSTEDHPSSSATTTSTWLVLGGLGEQAGSISIPFPSSTLC